MVRCSLGGLRDIWWHLSKLFVARTSTRGLGHSDLELTVLLPRLLASRYAKSELIERARKLALKDIQDFLLSF